MNANVLQRDNGRFMKGVNNDTTNRGRTTAKQLKQLCIDVLNEQGIGGVSLIERVIGTVARDKPEALLPFCGKLIPMESEQTIMKFSPIVFGNEIQPAIGVDNGLVVEQTKIETNVERVEPVVVDVVAIRKNKAEVCSIVVDDEL